MTGDSFTKADLDRLIDSLPSKLQPPCRFCSECGEEVVVYPLFGSLNDELAFWSGQDKFRGLHYSLRCGRGHLIDSLTREEALL